MVLLFILHFSIIAINKHTYKDKSLINRCLNYSFASFKYMYFRLKSILVYFIQPKKWCFIAVIVWFKEHNVNNLKTLTGINL